MPFLGKQPPSGFSSYTKQDLTADGSTTGFTLNKNVASANDVEVFVGNVRQEPTDAYTVSGNTLTMSAAPSSGTNFYVMFKEATQSTTVPSAGTTVPGNFGLTGTLSVDTIDVSTGSRVEFNEAIYTGDADGFRVGNIQLSRKDAYSTTDSYFAGSLPASGGSAPFNNYDHVVINAKSGRQIYFGTGGSERVRITDAGLSFDGGSNHIDDYEEGTWTPEITTYTNETYTNQYGVYTKIGNRVFFNIFITGNAGSASGGETKVSLPSTVFNNLGNVTAGSFTSNGVTIPSAGLSIQINIGQSSLQVYQQVSGGSKTQLNATAVGSSFEFVITGNYIEA